MLSKEKCEKAIDNVARYCSDYKLCMIPPRFELTNELEVLMDLIKEHFELVELLKPHGYGMLSADEFERWINYICKHNADNDMIIMFLNEQLESIKNPQPYKFEDLKVGMFVYDICLDFIYRINKIYKNKDIDLLIETGFGYVQTLTIHFEEGRFFPVTKALEYQK